MTNSHSNDRKNRSDGSLVRLLRDGEQQAATDLFLRYSDRLLNLARNNTSPQLSPRFDPEDVVQSVFRSFFRRVSNGAYDVPPGEELWRLLLVLSLNKVRALAKYHRAQKRNVEATLTGDDYADLVNEFSTPDPQPRQILEMVIDRVLGKLPDSQRDIVERRIQGESVVDIAASTQRSRRTVERIIKKFRDQIAELNDDE